MPQPTTRSRRSTARRRNSPARRLNRVPQIIGVAALAVAVVAALIVWGRPDDQETAGADYSSIPSRGTVLGNSDAPVKIVEYADFQCPFCGQFSQDVQPRIIDDFVRSGQASYELRILPFLGGRDLERAGNESIQATEAAACAMDQGAFWSYSDMIFARQAGENAGAFSDDRLIAFAADLELDVEAFTTCLESNAHHQTALDSYAAAEGAGIRSTPTILIDGQPVAYTSQGYELLQRQIQAAIDGKPIPQ